MTTNTYLALQDAQKWGRSIVFFRLTIEAAVYGSGNLTPRSRSRLIYQADVYTTNSALGFDYLIENLAENKDGQYLSPLSTMSS